MRSAKKKPFSKSRKRSKFKTTNQPQYNNSLRNRGRIDFMISKNLSDGWYADNIGAKKRGGQNPSWNTKKTKPLAHAGYKVPGYVLGVPQI